MKFSLPLYSYLRAFFFYFSVLRLSCRNFGQERARAVGENRIFIIPRACPSAEFTAIDCGNVIARTRLYIRLLRGRMFLPVLSYHRWEARRFVSAPSAINKLRRGCAAKRMLLRSD